MRTAWLPVLGLAVLAPVCAEYLWGYDESTGRPGTLIGNLLVFSPLYGAPALLVREVARRHALGWPGLLLLAGAAGVVQAGLVDQSMWSTDYRDISYWPELAEPTYVEPIGLSVYLALFFVGGHVILSFGSPVAVMESLAPRRRDQPWLGPVALGVVVALYAAACALVAVDSYDGGDASATGAQLAATAAVAVGLVVAAFAVGRRPALIVPGRVPSPWLVLAAAYLAMLGWVTLPSSRIGTALAAALGLAVVAAVRQLSHRGDWSQLHVLALAAGALAAAGTTAFRSTPLGDVGQTEKYAHNVVLLLLVLGLSAWGARRTAAGWT